MATGFIAELMVLMPLERWEQLNPNRYFGMLQGCSQCGRLADRLWWYRGKPYRFSCDDPYCFPLVVATPC